MNRSLCCQFVRKGCLSVGSSESRPVRSQACVKSDASNEKCRSTRERRSAETILNSPMGVTRGNLGDVCNVILKNSFSCRLSEYAERDPIECGSTRILIRLY